MQPSLLVSEANNQGHLFDKGQASFLKTGLQELDTMGVGIALYFRTMRFLSLLMLLSFLIALPILVLNRGGSGLAEEENDGVGLAFISLGNQGVSMSNVHINDCWFEEMPFGTKDCFGTVTRVVYHSFLGMAESSVRWYSSDIASVMTLCDMLYSFLFFGFVFYLKHHIAWAVSEAG